jgi:hypothetical protein
MKFVTTEEQSPEDPYYFSYEHLNSTVCSIKLYFRKQVRDPLLGKPDILTIKLKSLFVFISDRYKMPMESPILKHSLPL